MRNAAERAFLKTVELGSIRAAARALGQDPSGISRRITQLETRLGALLVDRGGKTTTLTAQGQLYFERLRPIMEELDGLEADIGGETLHPTGLLRVTSSIDFGQAYVTDWLLDFRERYPQVEFDLVLSGGYVDLNQNNIDVAIRAGRLPDSSLVARKIADIPRVLVASTAYLESRGMPVSPDDLSNHDFVFFQGRNRNEPLVLTHASGKRFTVWRNTGVSINAVGSVVRTVARGQGLHNGPLWAFADLIESGALSVVLPEYVQEAFPLYVVRQPAAVVPARVSRFIEFVRERVATVKGLVAAGR